MGTFDGKFKDTDLSGINLLNQKRDLLRGPGYMKDSLLCPSCGAEVERYRNPFPAVDIIIEIDQGIVLIQRKNPPYGWAIPGGFVDYGESLEAAAVREAKEETTLDIEIVSLLGVYSDPARDPRQHTISTVFQAKAKGGLPCASDDALEIGIFNRDTVPDDLAFDHDRILCEYFERCSLKR